jgi:hypothetical protein
MASSRPICFSADNGHKLRSLKERGERRLVRAASGSTRRQPNLTYPIPLKAGASIMARRQAVTQAKLADYISYSGFTIGIASLVPVYTQKQATPLFWTIVSCGAAIVFFGLAVRMSTTMFSLVARLLDAKVATITTCLDHHVDEVYSLARSFFGDEVTEPAKIKEIRAKYKNGLQVALSRERGERMTVRGYFFMFPINRRCVERIVDFTFQVSDLCQADIATQPRYGHAMYIGAIAGQGLMVRRELLGAIKLSGDIVAQTKTGTAYARAATDRGRTLLIDNGFAPVHPRADRVGCFYSR